MQSKHIPIKKKSYWKSVMEQFNFKYSKYFESSYKSQFWGASISSTNSYCKTAFEECFIVLAYITY